MRCFKTVLAHYFPSVNKVCKSLFDSSPIQVSPAFTVSIGSQHYIGFQYTVLVTSKGGNTQNIIYTSTGGTHVAMLNQPLVLKFLTDTLLNIRLLLVSTNECPPPDSAFVDVLVKPAEFEALAQVQADSAQFCIGNKVKLKGFATPGANTYWIAPNGSKILGDSINVDVVAGQNKWVFVADGCGYDTSVVQFTGKAVPTFDVDYLKTICPDVPVEFKVTTNGQVKFFFGDGTMSTQLPATHSYQLADTTLVLKATVSSTEGCTFDWMGPSG